MFFCIMRTVVGPCYIWDVFVLLVCETGPTSEEKRVWEMMGQLVSLIELEIVFVLSRLAFNAGFLIRWEVDAKDYVREDDSNICCVS